jgi:hypothetical protein
MDQIHFVLKLNVTFKQAIADSCSYIAAVAFPPVIKDQFIPEVLSVL